MTAAHCVADCTQGVEITVGIHDTFKPDSFSKTITAERAIYYEGYDPVTIHDDIAVVKLPQPIEYNGEGQTMKTSFRLTLFKIYHC